MRPCACATVLIVVDGAAMGDDSVRRILGPMARVEVHATTDVEEYAAAALAFLEADPCARSVLRTVVDLARSAAAPWSAPPGFWWVTDAGRTTGAANWTPPYGLAVSSLADEAVDPLAAAVLARSRELDVRLPSVVGPRDTAAAVAAAWTRATGEAHRLQHRLLLHELERVVEPRRPPGASRPATRADVELLVRWLAAFVEEAGVSGGADPRGSTERAVEHGTLLVWQDGEPVSFVNRSLPAAAVVRVGPVYTPPEFRNRGYARALTADASRIALAAGARRCMLFTDADNPVSNAIYTDIGYVPTAEHAEVRFGG